MKNQIMKIVIVLTCCVSFASVANATFIVDTDPGGEKFYINKDFEKKEGISAFTGEVGSNGDVAMVNVTTIGAVDTGNGYANVKPAKHAILTSLIFTPVDGYKYGDFSFRGQLENDGDVHVKVIDQFGVSFVFDFLDIKKNADFARIGIVSTDEEWIKSVEIYTTNGESFKEVKQIDFSEHTNPVPEPGTMLLLGIGMLGMAVYGKRRMNREA